MVTLTNHKSLLLLFQNLLGERARHNSRNLTHDAGANNIVRVSLGAQAVLAKMNHQSIYKPVNEKVTNIQEVMLESHVGQ